jgi:hypothetical protein
LSRRVIAVALAALAVATMLSNRTYRKRAQERAILTDKVEEYASRAETGRYVDVGVELRIVEQDPNGEELIPGMPRMRLVGDPMQFGGIADIKAVPPVIVGPSPDPIVWHVSRAQAEVLLHYDERKLAQLVYGSEGAGKSRTLAYWHYFQWIAHFGEGREGGQTAPTGQRLEFVRAEMLKIYPPEWFRYYIADERFEFCDGTRVQLVSTHRQSAAQGSPIQGFNWSWCGRDESQDQLDVHEDIESRGRSAKHGRYHQLATATAKDDSDWRTLRDSLVSSGRWERRQMSIFQSPFVAREFIDTKKDTMSPREFLRRYGREDGSIDDLPPELAVYPSWSRKESLVQMPDIGWIDVTARELAGQGVGNLSFLVGHDPGAMFDVSIVLKAYAWPGRALPTWVVIDEITTERTTTEQHVATLLDRMRTRWGANLLDRYGKTTTTGPCMFVRADPYGNNDSKPDRSCYTLFRNEGIRISPAVYNDAGDGPGRVPKREGIEVVNTLLCNARELRRLYVAADARGVPVAPRLVKALESSELDDHGNAETEKKNEKDQSHWPAALRYALWAIERPRLGASRTA